MYLKSLSQHDTLDAIFRATVARNADREALVLGDERLTYRELDRRVETLAASLAELGIGRKDHVALILPNCLEFVYTIYALARIGAVPVPLNLQSGTLEVGYILDDSDAVAVISDIKAPGTDPLAIIQEVRPNLPKLRHVIVRGKTAEPGLVAMDNLLAGNKKVPAGLGPETTDPVILLYTSGTTGRPKGAVHTHRSLIGGLRITMKIMGSMIKPSGSMLRLVGQIMSRPKKIPWFVEMGRATAGIAQFKWLVMTPFYHVMGYFQLLLTLLTGDKMVMLERFHPDRALDMITKERITLVAAVPPMLTAMLARPDFDRRDLSSLVLIGLGAMPVPPQLVREARKRTGAMVVIGYGATEMTVGTTTSPMDSENAQAETVGRPSPGVEMRIVDEEGRDVPLGTVGEIVVRGPGVMVGYFKKTEATAEAIDPDGWYHTGDLGAMDKAGYVRVAGRAKDMIIRAGANIYPAEIEHFLLTHPQIEQVAVIGVPAPEAGGERVRAYVVPKDGAELSVGDVTGYCWGKIAAYKVPEEVVFVKTLPTTPALQKVQHGRLREEAIKEWSKDVPEIS